MLFLIRTALVELSNGKRVSVEITVTIKYITLFLANFDPPTHCHTLSHIPGPPKVRNTSRTPPRFFVGLVQKSGQKPPVQILSQLLARAFVRGLLSGGLLSIRFCPGWFLSIPLLSEYICYNRKLKITLTH